jgi:hypothetical protein
MVDGLIVVMNGDGVGDGVARGERRRVLMKPS